MNPETDNWIDKLDKVTRSALTLGLGAAFVVLALRGIVGGDVFTNVFLVVIGFWFGAKGATDGAKDVSAAAKALTQPSGTGTGGGTQVTTTGPTRVNVPAAEPPKAP